MTGNRGSQWQSPPGSPYGVRRDELIAPNPKLKLLDQVREVMRLT